MLWRIEPKLTLDPFVVAIDLLMKTEEKLTINHHPWSCCLRTLLWSICGNIMSGRVIIGGVWSSFAELSIQLTNALINDSSGLALLISWGKCPFEDFNRRQEAVMVERISFLVEWRPCSEESHDAWSERLQLKRGCSNICQSPHEEIMIIHGNTVHDVEQQILHDANDFLIIWVVALDWTQSLRQNAKDCPRHILQFLHEEFGPWCFSRLQWLHQHLHVMIGQLSFRIYQTRTFSGRTNWHGMKQFSCRCLVVCVLCHPVQHPRFHIFSIADDV